MDSWLFQGERKTTAISSCARIFNGYIVLERFNIEKQHATLKWRLRLPFRSPAVQAHFTNSAD